MVAYVYILECSDGHYYVGTTRGDLEERVEEHNAGTYGGYTKSRRPVRLVFSQEFDDVRDAIAAERRLKGWSRKKKQALIAGDIDRLKLLSRNRAQFPHPSSGSGCGNCLDRAYFRGFKCKLELNVEPHPET